MKVIQTAERVSAVEKGDNFVYQRSLLAYLELKKIVTGGDVLEVGCGEGYGLKVMLDKVNSYTGIDKNNIDIPEFKSDKVTFLNIEIPPFTGIADNTFDFVYSFQVIEHIEKDSQYISEIHRVLKPGGKFIVSTPNIKMSLARNPWHVREYTTEGLKKMMSVKFSKLECKGVFAGSKAMEYYEQNKASVQKIMRFDIFDLQNKLPRQILQIPYDILNRMNRNKLLKENNSLTAGLTTDDFYISEANEQCLDLYYIAEK